jgi:hypothetical protein
LRNCHDCIGIVMTVTSCIQFEMVLSEPSSLVLAMVQKSDYISLAIDQSGKLLQLFVY